MGWFTLKRVPTIGKVLMITFWALFAPNGMPTIFKVTMVQHFGPSVLHKWCLPHPRFQWKQCKPLIFERNAYQSQYFNGNYVIVYENTKMYAHCDVDWHKAGCDFNI
jgi:hypothetical protein